MGEENDKKEKKKINIKTGDKKKMEI